MKRTICILVLYNPDMDLLKEVIDNILIQVDLLWISDNSTKEISLEHKYLENNKIKYQKMPGNVGIAAAQNYGIRYAIDDKFDYLYFLDQDSISPSNIIEKLRIEYEKLKSANINIGAIGPRPYNRGENKEYRGSIKKGISINENITEVTELISSASFIEVNTFKKVGLMDEKLFIDGVDHEWCWRANNIINSRFFIVEKIKLSHQLGEGDRYFLWKKVAIPTPFRTYYQFRNYFILIRRKYVPIYWKLSNGFKYIIKLFYFPIFISPRTEYFKNIITGIKDGIIN